jgi:hypothetical protein
MKATKILLYILLFLPTLLMQSCLKDQEDVFDEPSSQRMSEFLQAAQDTLVNAPNGWILDYYPEGNQKYGGFTYTIGFTKDDATIRFENGGKSETSLYKMKEDDGPVLSFDTYNTFLHQFATPSDGKYKGYEGDFEFVIDSVGNGVVKVHGKKTGNVLYLRKLQEPADNYLDKVVDNGNAFIPYGAVLNIGGQPCQVIFTSLNSRQLSIYDANGSYLASSAYNFTDKGIRLYEPLTINGQKVQYLDYDDDKLTLTADGVETSLFLVSPDVIAQYIGNIGSPTAGTTKTVTVPHLDQFNITSDASWVHITTNGNELTIKVDASTENVRAANIIIANKHSERLASAIKVTQLDLDALLGDWNLTMKAYDATIGSLAKMTVKATLDYDYDENNQQQLYLIVDASTGTYYIPAAFDAQNCALMLQSNQIVGTYKSYYLGNVYIFGGNSTAGYDNFYDMLTFGTDAEGNITTSLNGELLYKDGQAGLQDVGTTVENFIIGAFMTQDLSSDGYAGWWDLWSNTSMVKTSSTPAKPAIIGSKRNELPDFLKGIKPHYNSHPDFSRLNLTANKELNHIK